VKSSRGIWRPSTINRKSEALSPGTRLPLRSVTTTSTFTVRTSIEAPNSAAGSGGDDSCAAVAAARNIKLIKSSVACLRMTILQMRDFRVQHIASFRRTLALEQRRCRGRSSPAKLHEAEPLQQFTRSDGRLRSGAARPLDRT
jgi:hypothetical protein